MGEDQVTVAGEAVQGLEVQLDAGAAVHGRVGGLEPDDLRLVTVRAEGASFTGFDGTDVDHQGNYRVEHLLPGTYDIVAELSDSGRSARGQVTLEPGAAETQLDLQFEPGLTLSGRATQGDSPVVGATVFVEGIERDHTGWGQTDYQGAFSVDGLEPGSYRVNLRDFATGLAYNETVELTTSREIELAVPTAHVTGRVVDSADRRALSGVTLTLNSDDPATQGRLPLHTATTDLEGRFEIGSVADGAWRLTAAKQGFAAVSRPVTVQFGKPVDDLSLAMDATEGMTLEARLPSGAPPSEIRVAVMDPAGGALVSGSYATGEHGRVRLSSVPPGTWNVVVSAAGSAASNLEARAPGTTIPVALQPATALRVKVPDLAESGALAMVSLRDAAGKLFHSLSWNGRPQSEWRMTGGQLVLRSLPPGSWSVTVAAADGRSWTGDSVTSPGGTAELSLE